MRLDRQVKNLSFRTGNLEKNENTKNTKYKKKKKIQKVSKVFKSAVKKANLGT